MDTVTMKWEERPMLTRILMYLEWFIFMDEVKESSFKKLVRMIRIVEAYADYKESRRDRLFKVYVSKLMLLATGVSDVMRVLGRTRDPILYFAIMREYSLKTHDIFSIIALRSHLQDRIETRERELREVAYVKGFNQLQFLSDSWNGEEINVRKARSALFKISDSLCDYSSERDDIAVWKIWAKQMDEFLLERIENIITNSAQHMPLDYVRSLASAIDEKMKSFTRVDGKTDKRVELVDVIIDLAVKKTVMDLNEVFKMASSFGTTGARSRFIIAWADAFGFDALSQVLQLEDIKKLATMISSEDVHSRIAEQIVSLIGLPRVRDNLDIAIDLARSFGIPAAKNRFLASYIIGFGVKNEGEVIRLVLLVGNSMYGGDRVAFEILNTVDWQGIEISSPLHRKLQDMCSEDVYIKSDRIMEVILSGSREHAAHVMFRSMGPFLGKDSVGFRTSKGETHIYPSTIEVIRRETHNYPGGPSHSIHPGIEIGYSLTNLGAREIGGQSCDEAICRLEERLREFSQLGQLNWLEVDGQPILDFTLSHCDELGEETRIMVGRALAFAS